jgi:phytanoyl-CoA dioxygenase PhyH
LKSEKIMLSSKRKLPQGLAIATQSPEFWRRLAPELTISDAQPLHELIRPTSKSDRERMRLVDDGYLRLNQPGLKTPVAKIAVAMDRIVNAGLPAAFIGVYDEVWTVVAELNGVIGGMFDGKAAMVPDFWASHTVANTGIAAGRKRGGNGVFSDGTPKNVTVWVPLTDATPDNGCVYVVPAGQDRNYGKEGASRADASLPGIRALTAKAGDVLIWTGETYHWQGRPERAHHDGPLMSLNWEFQCRDEAPLEGLLIDSYPYVPFETRLALLARQMPRHGRELAVSPVWRAVQQTLANRFRIGGDEQRV